ncbi:phosphatase PAP2 family protein [Pelagerythrobacter rhizovicinus]|uniref:Phosphatase PAP2 family protein n=1 Tax=Pelagerythrobacter rhizovicinus TaxID=2268576 RepID=A0A4Q2KQG1_9SPHN|nr:phosphatase PAP2 family protein [Pelagerythrobacter rhizovicinus]RXZ65813.1 phosphatase PAP2 family protein [Pelagerythrobacter rhizovicinus]
MDELSRETPHLPAETIRLPERGFTIDRRKALIAGALCWTGFAVIVWLVANGGTEAFDRVGLLSGRSGTELALGGPALVREIVRDITALGGVFLRNLFAIGAVVALLFLRLKREAVLFAMTVITGWLVNAALKFAVGRERPQIVPHLMDASGQSFPSGHSFNAALVYIAMALAFAALSRRQSVRYTVIGAAMLISAMVAWSRVMLGVHFPSDVIAGWLGGAGWAFMAAALLYRPAKAAAESDQLALPVRKAARTSHRATRH